MAPSVSRRSLLGLAVLVVAVGAASQWWSARSQAQVGERLAAAARPGDIRMISSEVCAFCTSARLWMQRHRVPFEECFVERSTACAEEFRALGAPGTPVVLVRGRAQLGFAAERVEQALAAR